MIRGTTPTHVFNIPFNTDIIKDVRVIYAQKGEVVITKTMEECLIADGQIGVKLTQEDTFEFDNKETVEIQIKVLTTNDDVMACNPIVISVKKCLSEELL